MLDQSKKATIERLIQQDKNKTKETTRGFDVEEHPNPNPNFIDNSGAFGFDISGAGETLDSVKSAAAMSVLAWLAACITVPASALYVKPQIIRVALVFQSLFSLIAFCVIESEFNGPHGRKEGVDEGGAYFMGLASCVYAGLLAIFMGYVPNPGAPVENDGY